MPYKTKKGAGNDTAGEIKRIKEFLKLKFPDFEEG